MRASLIELDDPDGILRVWRTLSPDSNLEEINTDLSPFRWASKSIDGATFIECSLHGRLRARTDDGSGPMAGVLAAGDASMESADFVAHDGQPWLMSGRERHVAWNAYGVVRLVAFDPEDLQRTLIATSGAKPPVGSSFIRVPTDRNLGRFWTDALHLATRAFFDGAIDNALIEASLKQHLIETMIAAFGLEGDSTVNRLGAPSAALRRALAFIDVNAQSPITVVDIADAARMSVRGLQDAFQRTLGTTPTRELRRARLDGARHDLLHGEPGATSVERVALDWGFANASRFSRYYREEFGERPSRTLQR